MKRTIIFLYALLIGISGAWADETFTIIDNANGGAWTSNGSYSSDNGTSTWKGSWTSTSTTPQISINSVNAVTSNTSNTYLLQNSTGYIGSSSNKNGTFAISISSGYRITGYEIVFKNVNPDGSHNQTITPDGGSAVTAEGEVPAKVSITGLCTRTTKFVLTGENTLAKVTKFTITYEVFSTSSYTWSSGVPSNDVGGSGNYYSNCWYLHLSTPDKNDLFFNSFELSHASDGSADTDKPTFLAFTQSKFPSQYNHEAGEFIAISDNYLEGNSSSSANLVTYTFSEPVRLNGNTTVYACFVSKNLDGTYNLEKRGIAVKNTGSSSGLKFSNGNNYSTAEVNGGNYQCHYSCNYTYAHDFPQNSSDYHIWSGINYGDKTGTGKIHIAYMKYMAPGESGQFVHFDRFSLSMRNEKVVAYTYLLFSKECLTGTGVTASSEFTPSRFTAISTNSVPANYGKVFTFSFSSDSYLEGGQTYYIYMGTKKDNGNFCLQKYGIFINDQMNDKMALKTGFAYSDALETSVATIENAWQPIYYSSRCTFADQKVTVNVEEAGKTIRTRTIYTNAGCDLKTALNIPSVYTVTPATITHVAGSSTRSVTIKAAFTPSSTPATETNHIVFIKLHDKYVGGTDGKTLSASTELSTNDQWTVGGNYYDGYTLYNKRQSKYLSVDNSNNSQGTFVDESSAPKFIAETNSSGYSFKLSSSGFCYLNDHANNNVLSTWKNAKAASAEGSRIVFVKPEEFLTGPYTAVKSLCGTGLGQYSNPDYTQEQINNILEKALAAHEAGNGEDIISSVDTLKTIQNGLTLNLPTANNFYRFKIDEKYMCSIAESDHVRTATSTSDDATTVFYLDNNSYLIGYADGYGFNFGYCKATVPGIFNLFEFSESSQVGTYDIHTTAGTGDAQYSDRHITINGNKLAQGQGTWTIEEVTSLPVTISAAGFATLYAPVALNIPTGVTAYKATDKGEYLTLTAIEGIIPDNTGVILKGEAGTYNFGITTGGSVEGNMLTGTVAAIERPGGSYILSTGTEGVGFYSDGASTIPGFKSYLPAEATGSIRGFLGFNFDDPTAITAVEAAMNAGKTIYDLSGRRVENPTNGLYIVNGKKVFINKK